MTGHHEIFSRLDSSFELRVKGVKFTLDLAIIKNKTCLIVKETVSSVNTTSNDLLREQADVENYFQCFYC